MGLAASCTVSCCAHEGPLPSSGLATVVATQHCEGVADEKDTVALILENPGIVRVSLPHKIGLWHSDDSTRITSSASSKRTPEERQWNDDLLGEGEGVEVRGEGKWGASKRTTESEFNDSEADRVLLLEIEDDSDGAEKKWSRFTTTSGSNRCEMVHKCSSVEADDTRRAQRINGRLAAFRHQGSQLRSMLDVETGVPHEVMMHFPMYLITLKDLLTLDVLEPHQAMMRKGLLREWSTELEGEVMFVSHEWLGLRHADPCAEQLRVLQRMMGRLMDGSVSQVESHVMQQSQFKQAMVVSAEDWAKKLPTMWVWLDFIAIPQVAGMSVDDDAGNFKGELQSAVDSIPAYVERSSLMVVLSPLSEHRDKHASCSFSSWRSRGWTRLEFAAAVLAKAEITIMVCTGPMVAPFFIKPTDAWKLPACDGNFSCCENKHLYKGQKVDCDKVKVHRIINALLVAKDDYMTRVGIRHKRRHLICMRQWLSRGHARIEELEKDADMRNTDAPHQIDPLRWLEVKLDWDQEDDISSAVHGRTKIYYAALADDHQALKLALSCDKLLVSLNIPVREPETEWGERPFTPLMAAMVFASAPVVQLLLDVRADPMIESPGGNAFTLACSYGRADNVAAWLQWFPAWDLELRTSIGRRTVGSTALLLTACNAPEPGATAVTLLLLAARADPNTENTIGTSALGGACFNDNAVHFVAKLLLNHRADVNHQSVSSDVQLTLSIWRSQQEVELGKASALAIDTAFYGGCTPLMWACVRGKIPEVRVLLEHRADVDITNAMGKKAIDLAYEHFGGEPPEALVSLVSGIWA